MICKGQVSGWTVEIIIDSGSSTSIMSKRFMEYINRKPNRASERMITGIHGNKKLSEGIIDDVPVHLGDVVVSADMEVIDTNAYHLVLGNDWLCKAKTSLTTTILKLLLVIATELLKFFAIIQLILQIIKRKRIRMKMMIRKIRKRMMMKK